MRTADACRGQHRGRQPYLANGSGSLHQRPAQRDQEASYRGVVCALPSQLQEYRRFHTMGGELGNPICFLFINIYIFFLLFKILLGCLGFYLFIFLFYLIGMDCCYGYCYHIFLFVHCSCMLL